MPRRALNGANHDDGDGDKLAAAVVTARSATSSVARDDDGSGGHYRPLTDSSPDHTAASVCSLRSVFITVLVLALGIGMGTLGDMGYDRYIAKHSDDVSSTPSTDFIDPHMTQFWLLRNLPSILYYNHSTLANTTLFPRSAGVSWNSLASTSVQIAMVERAIWVMDQLLLPRYQPLKYFSAPGYKEFSWQVDRMVTLKKLRVRYINKLAAVRNGTLEPVGLIPKWYTYVDTLAFTRGFFPRTANLYPDTRWSSVAFHPQSFLVAMGTDGIESNSSAIVISRYLATEAGDHQLGMIPGMTVTKNGTHAWVASILTSEGHDSEVASAIKASTRYTDAAKASMLSRIMTYEMGQLEAHIIRLSRAYSHDRANLIAEGALKVTYDRGQPSSLTSTSSLASTIGTSMAATPAGPVAYGSDSTLRRQCLRLSFTPEELLVTINKLRNGDVLRYNDNQFGIIHKNGTDDGEVYMSDMIITFNRDMAARSRGLVMRRINTIDMMDTVTNDTTIAAVLLQGWSSWTNRTETSTTQVWGRVPVDSLATMAMVDATQLVANGDIHTWDKNHEVSYDSNECGGYSGAFDFCGHWSP